MTPTTDQRTFAVSGMTCSHCVTSVREEVSAVAGVATVDVDLVSGRMVVGGDRLDDAAIGAAVREAGYEITG